MARVWTVACPDCGRYISVPLSDAQQNATVQQLYRCEHCGAGLMILPVTVAYTANQVPFKIAIYSHGSLSKTAGIGYPQRPYPVARRPVHSTYPAPVAPIAPAPTGQPAVPQVSYLPRPAWVQVQRAGQLAYITCPWYRAMYLPLIACVIAIDSCFLFLFSRNPDQLLDAREGITIVEFPFILICAAWTLWALAYVQNKTVIEFEVNRINVYNEPLPWMGERSLPRDAITGIYYAKESTYLGNVHTIRATLVNGKNIRLVDHLPCEMTALYVLQEMARMYA